MKALDLVYQIPKRLFMRPPLYKLGDSQRGWQERADRQHQLFIPKIDQHVAVYEYGQGPVVLLIHGWGGRAMQLSPLIGPLLQQGKKVVLFDAPGHGLSEGVGSSYIEFVLAARAVAASQDAIEGIIAHSMGGGAAMVLASDMGREDLKTVLLAPHFDMESEFLEWADGLHVPRALLSGYIRLSEKRYAFVFDEINPKNLAARQKGPYLLVHDDKDKAAKFNSSEMLRQHIPRAEFFPTTGKGHNKIIGDAEVLTRVMQFLCGTKTP